MKKVFFLFLFVGSVFLLPSCDDDKESGRSCTAITQDLLDDLDALIDAELDYLADPSAANCAIFKEALEDYIDIAIEGRKCVPEDDLADYNDAIDELEDELALLPC